MLAILVVQFELRRPLLLKFFFLRRQLLLGLQISRTVIVGTFVNDFQIMLFPPKQRGLAMRAPIFGHRTMTLRQLKQLFTHFAANLRTFLAIVEIEIIGWGLTTRACGRGRHLQSGTAMSNRRERMTVFAFKGREQLLPIQRRLFGCGCGGEWRCGIDEIVAVVGMFFLKSSLGKTSELRFCKTSFNSATIRTICSRSNLEQIQMTKREMRSIMTSKKESYRCHQNRGRTVSTQVNS